MILQVALGQQIRVELRGFEPLTPSMRMTSKQCSADACLRRQPADRRGVESICVSVQNGAATLRACVASCHGDP